MSLPSSAPEPGLGEDSAEADGDGAERARRRRSEEAGGPTAETAPPGGGGETQVPQRRGAHHPAAAVSSTTHYKPLSNTNIFIFKQDTALNFMTRELLSQNLFRIIFLNQKYCVWQSKEDFTET